MQVPEEPEMAICNRNNIYFDVLSIPVPHPLP